MEVTARLAEFAVQARPPETALGAMRLSLFDWAACAIAGAAEPVSRIVRAQAEAEGGAAQASLAGAAALQVPARAAARVNGTVSHALDYDDTHFAHIGHPSVAVVPAALAVTERQSASADAFLRAALVGAEASVRAGTWLGRAHYEAGFHMTGTAGALGAAVSAGVLLGLDPPRMAQALSIAAGQAAGLKAQFGTMGKPLAAGHAASIGVEAADLAAAGFMANPRALEAPQGFAAAHLGSGEKTAFLGLGAGWEMERVSYKLHACCHGLHAMLEALAGLHLAPGSVDRVTVRTHPRWRVVCDIAEPRTGLEAKFSFRLTAAMALDGRDTAALETYSDAECRDPTLVALRDRVDVVSDPQLPDTAAEVSLTAAGGRHHTLRHDLAEPVTTAELHSRLRRKAKTLVGPEAASILAAATLEGTPDVSTLAALLRAAPA